MRMTRRSLAQPAGRCLTAWLVDFYRRQLTPQPPVPWGTPPPDPNIYTMIHAILVALVIVEGMIVASTAASMVREWRGEDLPWL